MAFPISPANGQEHKDYIYDSTIGAWKKNNDTPKEFPPDSNLIAYYPLDESVGVGGAVATYHLDGNALDSSGNGNHGTEANPAYLNNQLVDGTGTHIDLPISLELEEALKSGDFSFSLWWKQTSTGYAWMDRISFYANEESYFRLEHGNDATAERGYWCGISEVGSVLPISFSNYTYLGEDYNFHHYAIVYSRTSQRLSLYIDGIEVQQNTSANILQVFTSVSTFQLIRHDAIDDVIDEVNIFDRALSQAEITELYTNPSNKNLLEIEEDISGVQGAIATYHLDGDVLDSSGFGNDGTPTDITYENSISGSAAVFNGSTSTINHGSLFTSNTDIGISVWMKWSGSTTSDNQNILRQEDGDNRFLLALQELQSAPVLALGLYHGGAYSETDTIITSEDYSGKWRHIAVSGNSNGTYLYVDGEVIDFLFGVIDVGRTAILYSGSSGGATEYFDGSIDEINIFDRALTYKEVQELYNNPANKLLNNNAIDGLVGEWNLNGNANDTSGSGYHLATVGTPNWVQGRKEKLCLDNNDTSGLQGAFTPNLTQFTISFWMKPDDVDQEAWAKVFDISNLADTFYIVYLQYTDSELLHCVFANDAGTNFTLTTTSIDQDPTAWGHYTIKFDGSFGYLYLNGIYVTKSAFTGTFTHSFGTIGLGVNSDGTNTWNYQGLLENFKVYNRALSEQEILALAEQTHPVEDKSGNNNNGYSIGQLSSVKGVAGKAIDFLDKKEIQVDITLKDEQSISAWFKSTSDTLQPQIILNQYENINGEIYIAPYTGYLVVKIGGINTVIETNYIDNILHSFSIVFDGNNGTIYIDGINVYTTSSLNSVVDNGEGIQIGNKRNSIYTLTEDKFIGEEYTNLVQDPTDLTTGNWNGNSGGSAEATTETINGYTLYKIITDGTNDSFIRSNPFVINNTDSIFSLIVKLGTMDNIRFVLVDNTAAKNKIVGRVTFLTQVASVSGGTLLKVVWIDNSTVQLFMHSSAIVSGNTHEIRLFAEDTDPSFISGDYTLYSQPQITEGTTMFPFVDGTHPADVINETFTMLGKFAIRLKIEPKFAFDNGGFASFLRWVLNQEFNINWQGTNHKIYVQWNDGANDVYMFSSEFDDGTSFININQMLDIIVFVDLTSGGINDSMFTIIPSSTNIAVTDNSWNGTPDIKSSTFPTLLIGWNGITNQANSDFEYLRIYEWDGVKPAITLYSIL